MAILTPENKDHKVIRYCIAIKKKLGKDTGRIGTWQLGDYDLGSDFSVGQEHVGIYQTKRLSKGRQSIKMRFPQHEPVSHTEQQEIYRTKFKNAVDEWSNLTDEQKKGYNERAVVKKITGYALFIKEYMLSH